MKKSIFLLSMTAAVWMGGVSAAQQPAAPSAQATPTFNVPDQNQARTIADTIYNTWRVAMMRGNENAWRNTTTQSRQVKVRNLIVSQKGKFPLDVFRDQPAPPALENFVYVGALAGPTNRTLAATYMGKVQLGEKGKAEMNALVLEFVHENGRWRYDQSRFFNLSKLPKVVSRLKKRDLSVLQEQDGFHPYTDLPKAPPTCPYPQLIGKVFVDAQGREIDMRINGISLHDFADERRADVVSGGLKRGLNTISYTIRTTDAKVKPAMAIGLFVMPETPGNKPVCVFDHIIDAGDDARGGTFSFTVTNDMIASMNPKFTGTAPQPFHAVPLKAKPKKK